MARYTLLYALLAISAVGGKAGGAEIRLRKEYLPSGNLVLLGDVADVFARDAETAEALKAIELSPVPAAGTQRFFRARQIRDMLHARGVNLAAHRFSGASRIAIRTRGSFDVKQRPTRTSVALARQTQDRARGAIISYLRSQTAEEDKHYEVQVTLNPTQTRALSEARGDVLVTGGEQPWIGTQKLVLSFQTDRGPVRLPVEARVSQPNAIVVAVRPLRRGAIVRVSDVALKPAGTFTPIGNKVEVFHHLDEVVGLETTRSVATNQIIAAKLVRRRLMVRRGDVVTLYARTAGVEVRTVARARDDGSLGDFIRVQKLTKDRKELRVRVTGDREVDVLAQSASVDPVVARP